MSKMKLIFLLVFHGYYVFAQDFQKCNIKDSECQKTFYQNIGRIFAPVGIPSIGMLPLDPLHMENVTMHVMDTMAITLVDGECLGIGNCTVLNYETNSDTFHKTVDIVCDRIVIQGRYTIKSNMFFELLYGGHLHSRGNGSIVLEDWYFKFDYPFKLVKRDNGEIYTVAKFDEGIYVSDVWKSMVVAAESIMIDDEDVTKTVVDYINENWWIVLKTFGKSFHKTSASFYFEAYEKFFNNVPATKYYSGDLKPYL